MRFRCAHCRSTTELRVPPGESETMVVPCSSCGRRHRIIIKRPGPTPERERYRKASQFAELHRIDLASAYSVLEGLLSIEEAQAMRGRKKTSAPAPADGTRAPEPHSPTTAVRGKAEIEYDPGFADAVKDGSLTPLQAMERGERLPLGRRLSQRHRIPLDLALQVADNRIGLRQAMAEKIAREKSAVPENRRSAIDTLAYAVGAVVVVGLTIHVWNTWGGFLGRQATEVLRPPAAEAAPRRAESRPEQPVEPAPPLTEPRTDATGQVVEVEGPDPRSVLIAFCVSGRRGGRRDPIEIAPAVPPNAYQRFGVFRNLDEPGSPPRAIRIRKDARTGRWIAGDGRSPIPSEVPPAQPPGTHTDPVVVPPS